MAKAEIAGIPVEIVSREQAEQYALVVCAGATDPLYFPDNLTGPCAGCGDMLQWRPHAPKAPPKVCFRCARCRISVADAEPPDPMTTGYAARGSIKH